jgi:hypothetical protein
MVFREKVENISPLLGVDPDRRPARRWRFFHTIVDVVELRVVDGAGSPAAPAARCRN